ncbi:MAG: outer membrane protein assembly factor BamD [Bdellovibrionaceae bacterium]|nr:outer membrane protein assembly factor BamD [Pseudobdellovibrionaceae bacterium]
MKSFLFRLYFLVLISLFCIQCVTEPKVNLETPEGQYKLAEFYRKQDRYDEAIAQYKSLMNKFPYSKLALEAELKVADTHFKKEEFAEAYASYKTFKELHPTYPKNDYIVYQAAESLREQLPSTVDRDLVHATQAISLYDELLSVYPQSEYSKTANDKKLTLIQMLADKEIYIADFYFKQTKYTSALNRYEIFLSTFPQNKKIPYVLLRAAMAAKKADVPNKIGHFVSRLETEFPATSEAQQARKEFPNVH